MPFFTYIVSAQHLVERLEGWLLLALLPDSVSLLKRDGFALCCFSQFLVYADTQVEGLVGHELLVLDFVLVAEYQRVLALVLADELADDSQFSVLVFLVENVESTSSNTGFFFGLNFSISKVSRLNLAPNFSSRSLK